MGVYFFITQNLLNKLKVYAYFQCFSDWCKHHRVKASCELRVASVSLSCELRVASSCCELRAASWYLRVASWTMQVQICELINASCEFLILASWKLGCIFQVWVSAFRWINIFKWAYLKKLAIDCMKYHDMQAFFPISWYQIPQV